MLIHLSITSLIQHHHTHWKTESVSALEPNPAALVSDVLGEDRSAVSRTPRRHAAGEASRLIDTRYSILSHLTRTREAGRSSAALKLISWSFTRSGSTVSRYSVLMRLAAQTKKKNHTRIIRLVPPAHSTRPPDADAATRRAPAPGNEVVSVRPDASGFYKRVQKIHANYFCVFNGD